MSIVDVPRLFGDSLRDSVEVVPSGPDRYRVHMPVFFDDGDELAMILKKSGDEWVITDEGHTLMRLTYSLDRSELKSGNRAKVIADALSLFRVDNLEGRLTLSVSDDRFADAMFAFTQCVLRVMDVNLLSRERASVTFLDEFKAFVSKTLEKPLRDFQWHDPTRDKEGLYVVDCRIRRPSGRPVFLYAVSTDHKVLSSAIAAHQFEKWNVPNEPMAICSDMVKFSQKDLARLQTVCPKVYPALKGHEERIARDIVESVA